MSLRHVHHYVTLLQKKKKNDKNKNQKAKKYETKKV